MDIQDDRTAPPFRQLLQLRERQLRSMLRDPGDAAPSAGHDVVDFKDIATQESLAAVDEVQAEHASRELQQVLAALARIESHRYGVCLECGEAIDPHRLAALPATPLCIACQTLHEHERTTPAMRR